MDYKKILADIKKKSAWETIDVDCDTIQMTITEVKRMYLTEDHAMILINVLDLTDPEEKTIVYTKTHIIPVAEITFGLDPGVGGGDDLI